MEPPTGTQYPARPDLLPTDPNWKGEIVYMGASMYFQTPAEGAAWVAFCEWIMKHVDRELTPRGEVIAQTVLLYAHDVENFPFGELVAQVAGYLPKPDPSAAAPRPGWLPERTRRIPEQITGKLTPLDDHDFFDPIREYVEQVEDELDRAMGAVWTAPFPSEAWRFARDLWSLGGMECAKLVAAAFGETRPGYTNLMPKMMRRAAAMLELGGPDPDFEDAFPAPERPLAPRSEPPSAD